MYEQEGSKSEKPKKATDRTTALTCHTAEIHKGRWVHRGKEP